MTGFLWLLLFLFVAAQLVFPPLRDWASPSFSDAELFLVLFGSASLCYLSEIKDILNDMEDR